MRRSAALAAFLLAASTTSQCAGARFEVHMQPGLLLHKQAGRLFVILSATNQPQPRLGLGETGTNAPFAFARDVTGFGPGSGRQIDTSARGYPLATLHELSPGSYYAQAVFDYNPNLRSPAAPGNLFSPIRKIDLNPAQPSVISLELTEVVPPEEVPQGTAELQFVKIRSERLSRFHGRPIHLRAGIILPPGYEDEPSRRYPLWIRIGGFNTRYTTLANLMAEGAKFRKDWLAENAPRFLLLQLDGAGPLGDPYQVNSDNNGPYGDALIEELIPYVEKQFRARGTAQSRVLSGTSTGGWVALALQVFYPQFFNGAWASCPDPVDFRAFELINLYEDKNAYQDSLGHERPSMRDLEGKLTLTMRQEVGMENMLGRGDSYIRSGEQWGAWNAVFSPRGKDGLPKAIWDPRTGRIDRTVAEHWKKYDLRLILENHWAALAEPLRGKLHIASGEADQYFLNGAVHLLDASMSRQHPDWGGSIVYGDGKGHGWSNLSMPDMLVEMEHATQQP